MKITIYQNREVYKEESKIGNDSENKVETLEFEFPEEYRDFTKYIEFQIKGEKYVDLIEDNKYVITREVAKYGKIKTQLVLKKNIENDVLIFKSNVFELNVSKSINASENLVSTVGVDLIEKIVTKNSEQDFRLNTLEADNTTNKENISNLQNDNTTNKTNIKSLQDDNEVNKTDISNIKQEQTTQNTNISNLQTDNTSNKAKILDLEAKNTELDTNIQKNTDDIAGINAKNTTQDEEIEQLKEKDTAQDELIEELQAENTKLKKEINSMQIPGEATGNPIHLTDSSDLECEIAVVGNSEQETRQGYNLLDVLGNKSAGTTASSNGITYTINPNGSISVKGTATNNADYFIAGNWGLTTPLIELDGEYTSQLVDNTNASILMYLLNESTVIKGTTNHTTFTQTTNITGWFLRVNSGATVDTIIYPQLVKGTEIKPYEPYGAMPSPDYPSEIVTVGQNVQLFDKDNVNMLNAIINGTTKQIANFDTCRSVYIPCDNNQDYTVSRKAGTRFVVGTTTNTPVLNATCNQIVQNNTADSITIKTTENDNYLVVFYYNSGTDTLTEEEIRNSIKIEKGLVATAYSPYGQGSVEIEVCNENFFNFDKLTVTGREESEVTFDKELGKIEATASTSDSYLLKSFCIKGLEIGETYTIGFKHKTKNCTFGGNGVFRLSSTASYNSYDYGYVNGSTSETYSSKTFVAITDALTLSFLGVNGTAPSDTCTMYAKDIMLVKGATAKNYIPHQSYTKVLPIQKEFVKIGDVEGTFVKVEGKWYEKHDIPKYIFTGNESFSRGSTRNGFYYFETTISDLAGKYAETNRILCNVAKEISSSDMYEVTSQKDLIGTTSKNVRLMLSNINTVAELQAYLSEQYANETPATLYYLSTTPELIPCTAEQSAILNSFYTYKGVTNISMSGIGTLKVNYKKDLETLFNNINSALLS